ncbi:hypothetical protein K0M31_011922 [Melipona bicolor]|uniref:Uncharacterized protein n=1 Tax=Melipona bicolor TaxID=60889 RepID=A0AA40GAI2_9HYME|nr:hypothetical protein K0M31_011922 [Melipona bicolor]
MSDFAEKGNNMDRLCLGFNFTSGNIIFPEGEQKLKHSRHLEKMVPSPKEPCAGGQASRRGGGVPNEWRRTHSRDVPIIWRFYEWLSANEGPQRRNSREVYGGDDVGREKLQ